jgi:hypothetical protein
VRRGRITLHHRTDLEGMKGYLLHEGRIDEDLNAGIYKSFCDSPIFLVDLLDIRFDRNLIWRGR